METRAAILWEPNAPWSVETITLDPPKQGEVLVEMVASGMCHSDEHLVTGDLPFDLPIIGGHEGAGVVEEAGSEIVKFDPARVTDDELCALSDLLFYHHANDRVRFSRVGTDHHDSIGMFD